MLIDDIRGGETDRLEFKEVPNRDSAKWLKTAVAFANGRGGRIVFGVANDRRVIGLKGDLFAMKDSIADAVAAACEPMPNICVEIVNVVGKAVLLLEVLQGRQCPYYIRAAGDTAGVYVRYDATTRRADEATLQELRLDGAGKGYDAVECRGMSVDDADIARLCQRMYDEAVENAPTPAQRSLVKPVTKRQLLKWGVLIECDGAIRPSNAYALLAGSDLLPTMVKCAIFRGTSRAFFLDRHPIEGSVIDLINESYKWILSKLNVAARLVGTKRVDVFEIPPDAIRELIINAVVHRTYVDGAASPISVALYDDRLEITSPGGLPRGMTVAKMLEGHSECRNKALASALEYMFFIENWGTGMLRVKDSLLEAHLPQVQVSDYGTSLRMIIKRLKADSDGENNRENNRGNNRRNNRRNNRGNNRGDNRGDNEVGDLDGQQLKNLPVEQRKICEIISNNPSISVREIAKILQIRFTTVFKQIKALKSKGALVREGGTRGHWRVLWRNS